MGSLGHLCIHKVSVLNLVHNLVTYDSYGVGFGRAWIRSNSFKFTPMFEQQICVKLPLNSHLCGCCVEYNEREFLFSSFKVFDGFYVGEVVRISGIENEIEHCIVPCRSSPGSLYNACYIDSLLVTIYRKIRVRAEKFLAGEITFGFYIATLFADRHSNAIFVSRLSRVVSLSAWVNSRHYRRVAGSRRRQRQSPKQKRFVSAPPSAPVIHFQFGVSS